MQVTFDGAQMIIECTDGYAYLVCLVQSWVWHMSTPR